MIGRSTSNGQAAGSRDTLQIVAAPFHEVYRNSLVFRGGLQVFAGLAWTAQSLISVLVGVSLAGTGIALLTTGEGGWVAFGGIAFLGIGIAGCCLPAYVVRKTRPMATARRLLREGRPLPFVEGVASTGKDSLSVAGRTFDLNMTMTNPTRLDVDGKYVRVTYVPDSDLLAIIEVRD